MKFIIVAMCLAIVIPPVVLASKLYKWIDKDGVVHTTDNPETVPPEYRGLVKEVESIEDIDNKSAEKKEATSKGIRNNYPIIDLNTIEFKYFSYLAKLKGRIEREWSYPEESKLRGEQGKLILVFAVRRDGYLEDVQLTSSSGYSRLDNEAIRSVRAVAPFSPFPKSWDLEGLNIRAVFTYEIRLGETIK